MGEESDGSCCLAVLPVVGREGVHARMVALGDQSFLELQGCMAQNDLKKNMSELVN